MIIKETVLSVVDNSGVKEVRCLEVLSRSKRGYGVVGDFFVGTVVSLKPLKNKNQNKSLVGNLKIFKRGEIVRGLIVRTSKNKTLGKSGFYVKSLKGNSAVLLKANNEPVSTRVYGPLDKDLRIQGHFKVVSIGKEFF